MEETKNKIKDILEWIACFQLYKKIKDYGLIDGIEQ